MSLSEPLNDRHFGETTRHLHTLSEVMREIERAAKVGFDLTDEAARAEYYRQQIQAIRDTYFPHKKDPTL